MGRRKKLSSLQVAVNIIERHKRFLQNSYGEAPEMSDCGRYFLGPEEDIIDDGVEAGIYYHTKNGGEGPYYCFYSRSFEEN